MVGYRNLKVFRYSRAYCDISGTTWHWIQDNNVIPRFRRQLQSDSMFILVMKLSRNNKWHTRLQVNNAQLPTELGHVSRLEEPRSELNILKLTISPAGIFVHIWLWETASRNWYFSGVLSRRQSEKLQVLDWPIIPLQTHQQSTEVVSR